VKVRTPELDTLYWVIPVPLKKKGNSRSWTGLHAGVAAGPVKIVVQPAGSPPPGGYSVSVFKPPGFVPAAMLVV
jgi:hypothetical protein